MTTLKGRPLSRGDYGQITAAREKRARRNDIRAAIAAGIPLDKFIAERNEAQRQQKWLNMASGFPTLRVTK
jgi:hypothetical protein